MNRSTTAALALSFAAVMGSVPAFAFTTADGVYDFIGIHNDGSHEGVFRFYDKELGGSYLPVSDEEFGGLYVRRYFTDPSETIIALETNINRNSPYHDPALGTSMYSVDGENLDAIPRNGYGIFDFQNSFVYYSDGTSQSLTSVIENDAIFAWLDEGDVSVLRWIKVGAEVTGFTLAYNLNTIPEPETWAMLLAGLGIVGIITRKRQATA